MDIKNIIKKELMPAKHSNFTNRIGYIDFIKLVAAFLTVFYHFAYYKLNYRFVENEIYYPNVARIIMCFAACCVPLFFMINGALLLDKKRSWKSIYLKIAKIIILILVWSIVGFPSWFFMTLVILYLIYPVLQYAYRQSRLLFISILGAFLLMPFTYNALCLLLKIIWKDGSFCLAGNTFNVTDLTVTGFFTMYAVVYFLLGPVLMKRNIPLWVGIVSTLAGWFYVTVECTIYTNMNESMYDGVNAAFPTYGGLFLSIGVFVIIKHIPLKCATKILNWLGSAILPIYLLHMFVINCIKAIVGSFTLGLTTAIIGTLFIFLICILIGKVIEKIPILCWFMKI